MSYVPFSKQDFRVSTTKTLGHSTSQIVKCRYVNLSNVQTKWDNQGDKKSYINRNQSQVLIMCTIKNNEIRMNCSIQNIIQLPL